MHSSIILAGVLGIDITDKVNAVFMEDATHDIKDMKAFIAYCKDKKGNIKTFGKMEKIERLDTLATEYKELERRAAQEAKYVAYEKYAKEVAAKVEEVREFVEEKCCKFSELSLDGEKFFKDHQLRALEAVGSQLVVIEYSYTNRLAGEIYKIAVKNLNKKPYEKLSHNQEKVQALLSPKKI